MSRGLSDRLPALCFGTVSIVYLFLCNGIPAAAAAMPLQVGWVTLLLCVVDLVALQISPPAKPMRAQADLRRQGVAVGGVLLLGGAMLVLGLLPAVALFMFVALRVAGRRGLVASLVTATLVPLALWAVFNQVLQLDLFAGLLFGGEV